MTVPLATIAAQGLGTFNVTARLTDTAGNASADLDGGLGNGDIGRRVGADGGGCDHGHCHRQRPSSSDYVTNDTTLTVSGTHGLLGPGETVQVSSDGGASWFNATSTASTWSYTDPTTHGTSFTYRVRTIDTAGNIGANTTSQAVTIDTVAPGAPSITAIPEDGGGGIDAAEALDGTPVVVDLTGTGAVAGDRLTIHWGSQTVNYTLPAGLLAGDISGNSATVTVPFEAILAQGLGMFDVTATLTDTAGNASSSSRATSVTVAGGHGDVHMVCFDGLTYDFQAVGDYVAVQSTDAGNPWQVQIRTASFPGATSITTALAATLGADYVSFAVGRANPVLVDGAPDALQVGAVQSLAGGTLAHPSANVYQLSWNTGQSVTVTDQGGYLDWTVGLGPHDGPGSVRGLLGSNSGPATDFQLPNGTVLAHPSDAEILSVFADAWSVAPGTSLLDETHAPNPALLVQTMAATPSSTGAAHDVAVAQPGANSDAASVFLVGVAPLHS